jgi:hypothetical protein
VGGAGPDENLSGIASLYYTDAGLEMFEADITYLDGTHQPSQQQQWGDDTIPPPPDSCSWTRAASTSALTSMSPTTRCG